MRTRLHRHTLVVTAVVTGGALLAQPEIVSIDPEEQLLQQIAEMQAEAGASRPPGLADPLGALAMLHYEAGNHALAIAALEEARYVTRVNQGLSSADEALLLRQQIRSEKALGQHDRVWELEQDMVTIARRHHDDSRMVPIFGELASEWSDLIDQVRAGERPPMIYLGCYYGAPLPPYEDTRGVRLPRLAWGSSGGGGPNCTSGTRDTLLFKLRAESLMYYADAIETILKTGDYASSELRELETAAFRMARNLRVRMRYDEGGGSFAYCSGGTLDDYLALDILRSCLAPVGRADSFVAANVGGSASLIRRIIYEQRSAAPAADRARAIVELADWNLASIPVDRRHFHEPVINWARSTYERAYRELQRGGDAAAAATELFAPETPVTLPAFEPNPFVAAAARRSSRYIDVAFAVTRYGRAEDVEILAMSDDVTRGEKRDLLFLIESATFRPRLVDGALADSAPVTLRYHLNP